jgi:hypothetical protein
MNKYHNKLISSGAIVALVGFITSGPLGLMLVKLTKPQPLWVSAPVFAANYHFVQDIPYYFGFLLIGGMLMVASGHYLDCTAENKKVKFNLLLSLSLTTAFAVLIFFNYICQTTFIRHLAINNTAQNDSIIATFSMANPMSLSWAIEMWGYGVLGVATWLVAEYYKEKNNIISWLLILNGIVSTATIVFTILDINWVLTTIGLIAYMFWNALMIVLMIMIYRYNKSNTS